jgi:formylmethanofuran dehydrogenase subunit E
MVVALLTKCPTAIIPPGGATCDRCNEATLHYRASVWRPKLVCIACICRLIESFGQPSVFCFKASA